MPRLRFAALACIASSLAPVLAACGGQSSDQLFGSANDDGGTSADALPDDGAETEGGDPDTTAPDVPASAVDLLVMVDNSSSMADKQAILGTAVPDLVARFSSPRCIDVATGRAVDVAAQPSSPDAPCPAGARREFAPVRDVHVGVISSSLGGHGADTCSPVLQNSYDPAQTDMAHLLDRKLGGGRVPTWNDQSFLFWDPGAEGNPPGASSVGAFVKGFQDLVVGVDQTGCGFESQLEAVYRFLADPHPYASLSTDAAGALVRSGEDQVLLQQRAAFLRPDSLLAIVSITDEDDCSVREEEGRSYYAVLKSTEAKKSFRMPRATSACKTNPDDPCCSSCLLPAEAGCPAPETDPECQVNGGRYTDAEDTLNLRCWEQKRRFGVDFLQPTRRYVDMLRKPTVDGPAGPVPNPIFASSGGRTRDPRNVFWTMIVGVPWQDIARDPSDLRKGYLPTTPTGAGDDFVSRGTWDVVLGDPGLRKPPTDPLMIASVDPRSGTSPVTNAALVPPAGSNATPPALDPRLPNGHEWVVESRDDLQYACIFPLPAPRDCADHPDSCDCAMGLSSQNPLCQDPQTGAPTTTQWRGKAYPGTRHLAVAKGLGAHAIVASICPADVEDATRRDFGYRPAVDALLERAAPRLVAAP